MDIMAEVAKYWSDEGTSRRVVMLGCMLLGISSGLLGTFALLRRQSLLGDAMAHAALPGVCVVFLLTGQKSSLLFLVGALGSGLVGAQLITWITRFSRIKNDTAIGLVLSIFFGVGVLLLSVVQQSGFGNQSGLDTFLFGKAAFLLYRDVVTLAVMGAILILLVSLYFKEFKVLSFDPGFGASIGLPIRFLDQFLTALVVVSVMIGLQVVGVILMAALLIIPAAAARQWTDRLGVMCWLAACVGGFSGVLGAFLSAWIPKMPTGPVMVLASSVLFLFSLLFAPRRGLIPSWRRRLRSRRKVLEENLLKTMYKLCEVSELPRLVSVDSLCDWTSKSSLQIYRECRRLERKGYLEERSSSWYVTEKGWAMAEQVVRYHRLWELYLTRQADIAIDHVHRDADEMEHFLSPELVAQLENLLDQPDTDPHGSVIPSSPPRENRPG